MAKTTEGKCMFCNEVFKKVSMKKHIEKCNSRAEQCITTDESKMESYYCIMVQGHYNSGYWLYLDVPINSTFKALDSFLRDVWLECCGHMSLFEVGGQNFASSCDSTFGDKSMNAKLVNYLDVGTQFTHQYDFGSTTYLKLKVVSEFYGKKRKKKVALLARNLPINFKCSECEETATNLCCECDSLVCDNCIDEHECGEDMLLPMVNSPRAGECGYTGGIYD